MDDKKKNEHFLKVHQQLYLLELRAMITGFNSNSSISKSYDRNKSAACAANQIERFPLADQMLNY